MTAMRQLGPHFSVPSITWEADEDIITHFEHLSSIISYTPPVAVYLHQYSEQAPRATIQELPLPGPQFRSRPGIQHGFWVPWLA